VRSYVAVRGGLDVPAVLGSRSTDLLSGLGPSRLRPGDVIAVGDVARLRWEVPDAVVIAADVDLPLLPGPRLDLFAAEAFARLLAAPYVVTPDSNRVALRLDGEPLHRTSGGELASEGLVRGALQVPPSGQPVLFLADHPVTGGYPVVAVVPDAATDRAAQARPGSRITFRVVESPH
jgi:allophanate hydrolase subunit 2